MRRPGGVDDGVELVLPLVGLDPRGGNPHDRRLLEVDQMHVLPL